MARGHGPGQDVTLPRGLAAAYALLPPTSGASCARALRRAGFDVVLDGPDHAVVKVRGATAVRIPLVDRIRTEVLAAILKTVGMTPEDLVALLEG